MRPNSYVERKSQLCSVRNPLPAWMRLQTTVSPGVDEYWQGLLDGQPALRLSAGPPRGSALYYTQVSEEQDAWSLAELALLADVVEEQTDWHLLCFGGRKARGKGYIAGRDRWIRSSFVQHALFGPSSWSRREYSALLSRAASVGQRVVQGYQDALCYLGRCAFSTAAGESTTPADSCAEQSGTAACPGHSSSSPGRVGAKVACTPGLARVRWGRIESWLDQLDLPPAPPHSGGVGTNTEITAGVDSLSTQPVATDSAVDHKTCDTTLRQNTDAVDGWQHALRVCLSPALDAHRMAGDKAVCVSQRSPTDVLAQAAALIRAGAVGPSLWPDGRLRAARHVATDSPDGALVSTQTVSRVPQSGPGVGSDGQNRSGTLGADVVSEGPTGAANTSHRPSRSPGESNVSGRPSHTLVRNVNVAAATRLCLEGQRCAQAVLPAGDVLVVSAEGPCVTCHWIPRRSRRKRTRHAVCGFASEVWQVAVVPVAVGVSRDTASTQTGASCSAEGSQHASVDMLAVVLARDSSSVHMCGLFQRPAARPRDPRALSMVPLGRLCYADTGARCPCSQQAPVAVHLLARPQNPELAGMGAPVDFPHRLRTTVAQTVCGACLRMQNIVPDASECTLRILTECRLPATVQPVACRRFACYQTSLQAEEPLLNVAVLLSDRRGRAVLAVHRLALRFAGDGPARTRCSLVLEGFRGMWCRTAVLPLTGAGDGSGVRSPDVPSPGSSHASPSVSGGSQTHNASLGTSSQQASAALSSPDPGSDKSASQTAAPADATNAVCRTMSSSTVLQVPAVRVVSVRPVAPRSAALLVWLSRWELMVGSAGWCTMLPLAGRLCAQFFKLRRQQYTTGESDGTVSDGTNATGTSDTANNATIDTGAGACDTSSGGSNNTDGVSSSNSTGKNSNTESGTGSSYCNIRQLFGDNALLAAPSSGVLLVAEDYLRSSSLPSLWDLPSLVAADRSASLLLFDCLTVHDLTDEQQYRRVLAEWNSGRHRGKRGRAPPDELVQGRKRRRVAYSCRVLDLVNVAGQPCVVLIAYAATASEHSPAGGSSNVFVSVMDVRVPTLPLYTWVVPSTDGLLACTLSVCGSAQLDNHRAGCVSFVLCLKSSMDSPTHAHPHIRTRVGAPTGSPVMYGFSITLRQTASGLTSYQAAGPRLLCDAAGSCGCPTAVLGLSSALGVVRRLRCGAVEVGVRLRVQTPAVEEMAPTPSPYRSPPCEWAVATKQGRCLPSMDASCADAGAVDVLYHTLCAVFGICLRFRPGSGVVLRNPALSQPGDDLPSLVMESGTSVADQPLLWGDFRFPKSVVEVAATVRASVLPELRRFAQPESKEGALAGLNAVLAEVVSMLREDNNFALGCLLQALLEWHESCSDPLPFLKSIALRVAGGRTLTSEDSKSGAGPFVSWLFVDCAKSHCGERTLRLQTMPAHVLDRSPDELTAPTDAPSLPIVSLPVPCAVGSAHITRGVLDCARRLLPVLCSRLAASSAAKLPVVSKMQRLAKSVGGAAHDPVQSPLRSAVCAGFHALRFRAFLTAAPVALPTAPPDEVVVGGVEEAVPDGPTGLESMLSQPSLGLDDLVASLSQNPTQPELSLQPEETQETEEVEPARYAHDMVHTLGQLWRENAQSQAL